MVDDLYSDARALEKLGLITFTPCLDRKKRANGSYASATQEGLKILLQHGMLPKHREIDIQG
jgi:hypothetical protein